MAPEPVGAGRGQVLRLVLGRGLLMSLAGVGIGVGVAAWTSRLMQGLLHDVTPGDPVTFLSVGVILSVVATIASAVPAWRATRVDPVIALKSE